MLKTIACLQYHMDKDWQQRVNALIADIQAVDLMILPELCHLPYFCIEEDPKWWQQAITPDNELFRWISKIARQKKSHIVFPFFEKANRCFYNSAVLIDDQGQIIGSYRKMHIPQDPGFSEKFYFTPGSERLQPIDSKLGKIGLLICWDQWFPEAARTLALRGAELLCYPTAIAWDSQEASAQQDWQPHAWRIAQQAHALCNQIPVAVANRWGNETALPSSLQFWGQSFIAAADGQICVQAPAESDQVILADWPTLQAQQWCDNWHFWRDRRPNIYHS